MAKEEKGITVENCRVLLANFMEKEEISAPQISKVIGCSHATTARLLAEITLPTEEFMKQTGILIEIGYEPYSKLSKTQKEGIAENIGAIGGGILGFGGITAAVSSSGAVVGLGATGISSGLAAVGFGGMMGGLMTVAAVPALAALGGYSIIKGVKYLFAEDELNSEKIDERWEIKKIQND